jgi:hypothetical protein
MLAVRVRLEIIEGPELGRRVRLQEGLVARFGQTEWADFCFAADPTMADFHFMVDCRLQRCILYALGTAETFVNSKPAARQDLIDGDRVRAGQTEFLVRLEGAMAGAEGGPRPLYKDAAATTAAAMTVSALCGYLKLGNRAPEIATTAANLADFCSGLAASGDYLQAFQTRAFTLGMRAAVAWGCHQVGAIYAGQMEEAQANAWRVAAAWVQSPDQAGCRRAEAAAIQAERQGPGGWLAMATFWCGESLAPATSPEPVPPELTLFSRAVAGALTLAVRHAAADGGTDQTPLRYQAFMRNADALESGELVLFESERGAER